MKTRKIETYFIHYRTDQNSKFFVFAVKNCKIPEFTKEYKKLHTMLYSSLIHSCGYCDAGYYKENRDLFISNLK